MKIRFIEPGNRPYRKSILNYIVYDRYIRTPSVGLNTLAAIVKREIPDTYMYSESISKIDMPDVLNADIIFIGFFTYAAVRGYELANYFRQNSRAVVVLGGLLASMNYEEAVHYNGNTVHRPKNMTPYELQLEHIDASKKIYSVKSFLKRMKRKMKWTIILKR